MDWLTLAADAPLKSVAVMTAFALFFALERILPARAYPGIRRIGRNLGLWALAVASAAMILPLTQWAASLQWFVKPDAWTARGGFIVDVIVLDLWVWFWHWANHQVPLLWRFHRVHHLDQHLDTTSALRFHFGETIISAIVRLPLIVLIAVPASTAVAFEALVLIAAIFHHSNIKISAPVERILSRVIVTPGIHWVHHHTDPRDTDSNYATIISVWDRIFRTRSATRRFDAMPIGLASLQDSGLGRLIASPFQRVS